MAVEISRKRFTTSEYHSMAAAGILSEDDRVELIEGEILEMAAIGSRHAACVKRLNGIFTRELAGRALVGVQDPIQLDDFSEPEPDLALLRPHPDFYAQRHPTPADIFLLVEVADASGDYDRTVKSPLYAASGIPEAWLVDLVRSRVEVYREPSPRGYRGHLRLSVGERLSPLAFPGLSIAVEAILG